MNHAISNTGSLEADHYSRIEAAERADRAFSQRSDRLRDEMTWQRLEEIMAEAPNAQRKAFWSQLLGLLDVEPRFMVKQNVSLMAEPLQDAVALAIDEQVRKEMKA
jgi:hypothetical protein